MYNDLSSDYDRFVNWQDRLAIELPFIITQLQSIQARSVLDAATGTGMHAVALAQLGYHTAGADISSGMLERARANMASAGVKVQFEFAGFGVLSQVFGQQAFNAILCLGNSLPHLLSRTELDAALHDFNACLHPGGLLIIQNRNFNAVMKRHERYMEPQSHSESGTEYVFQRFYDFDPDGLLTFNLVTLKRVANGRWSQKVVSSRLRPILQGELLTALSDAGFEDHQSYGSMGDDQFDPQTSSNLVIITHLSR